MAICEPPTIVEAPSVAHEIAEIVRSWPDERHTTNEYMSADPLPSFCAIGCILESAGWSWNGEEPYYAEIEDFLREKFRLERVDIGAVVIANDYSGKLAAADVIEKTWR